MITLYIILSLAAFCALAALITAFVCFIRIFYSDRKPETEEFPIPPGAAYEEYREDMVGWMKSARALPQKDYCMRSRDGLILCGKYYEYEKGAPIEIIFHGYKGTAYRDLSGGIARCHMLGHSAFIVDHRAAGASEGRVITFGVKESDDWVDWVNFVVENVDPEAKIIIAGISMGAATVMMASSKTLPPNVIGVVADCGYTSAEEIIKKVIDDMGLPSKILYPFARLGGMLFGNFDVALASPVKAMEKTKLPVIFFHGDTDGFVPYYMSEKNYAACASDKKRLVTVEGADHGLAFPRDKEKYISELKDFFGC